MPTIAQLFEKQLSGQTLLEDEKRDIVNAVSRWESQGDLFQSFLKPGAQELNLKFPWEILYSERLTVDTPSINIAIPSDAKHLMIYMAGKMTTAGSAGNGSVFCQFNGDTSSNYKYEVLEAEITTVTATRTSATHAFMGKLASFDALSNESLVAEILNYAAVERGKNITSRSYNSDSDELMLIGSKWDNSNSDPIVNLEIYGTDNSLSKGSSSFNEGSVISIYKIN